MKHSLHEKMNLKMSSPFSPYWSLRFTSEYLITNHDMTTHLKTLIQSKTGSYTFSYIRSFTRIRKTCNRFVVVFNMSANK